MSEYALWQFVHILLLVVWLGALHAMFSVTRYAAREDFPAAERQHLLALLRRIDMGPRTALILMIPVGFTMALELGAVAALEGALAALWVICLAWLALNWHLYLRPGAAQASRLAQWDRALRVLVSIVFVALGVISLVTRGPVHAAWLAAKITLFGVVVTLDLRWQVLLRQWTAQLAALPDARTAATTDVLLGATHRGALNMLRILAVALSLIAFLGVVKPLLD
jgi:hypothetical protein